MAFAVPIFYEGFGASSSELTFKQQHSWLVRCPLHWHLATVKRKRSYMSVRLEEITGCFVAFFGDFFAPDFQFGPISSLGLNQ